MSFLRHIFIVTLYILCFGAVGSASAQKYISKVLEYTPAPGQFINKAPWGTPESAQSIVGGITGSLSLGAWGGYVVFRFEDAVINHPNHPYGIDFIIFGSALSIWSEPGSVWVMKDENENGIPDGTWYLLAGSDYFFSAGRHQHEVTYFNPGSGETDVPWRDDMGNTGYVKSIGSHTQNYYPDSELFPHIASDSLILKGSIIKSVVNTSNPAMIVSATRAFGYADNRPRGPGPYHIPDNPYTGARDNAGADGFDISWAVDENGEYVELDKIHFIKVQTAVLANAGWQGEVSTEITGAVKTEATGSLSGTMDLVVIKDLPPLITDSVFPLEGYAFHRGRIQREAALDWEVLTANAYIDDNNYLTAYQSGPVEIKLSLTNKPDIYALAHTIIDLEEEDDDTTSIQSRFESPSVILFPNPANNHINLKGVQNAQIDIFDTKGQKIWGEASTEMDIIIAIKSFPRGLYFVRVRHPDYSKTIKLIID